MLQTPWGMTDEERDLLDAQGTLIGRIGDQLDAVVEIAERLLEQEADHLARVERLEDRLEFLLATQSTTPTTT